MNHTRVLLRDRDASKRNLVFWCTSSAAQWLGIAVLSSLSYKLLKQQGEMLLRMDEYENEERVLEASSAPATSPPDAARWGSEAQQGLEVTSEIPPFSLPTADGTVVSSEDLRGRRLLLVHWDSRCGYCESIAGELSRLREALSRRKTDLVLVARGGAEENESVLEQHGLDGLVVFEGPEPVDVFSRLGTPAAYLVDERGRVARPLVLGTDEVLELAGEVAHGRNRLRSERPLTESRIEREGIKPGTVAPAFALPDLTGATVRLGDFRGRKVIVVFSDPDCGPCNALMPRLGQLARESPVGSLDIVVVSRGEVDNNRSKIDERAVPFPVVIQPGWQVSREFGIFSTPVAFLIDEHGVVAEEVARGGDEVLQLARRVTAEEGRHLQAWARRRLSALQDRRTGDAEAVATEGNSR